MPDKLVLDDDWSDLSRGQSLPNINVERLGAYRLARLREQLQLSGAAMCVLVNPVSLRYAVDYRTYGLFQSHIPTTYLFVPLDGPIIIYNTYANELSPAISEVRKGQPISFFDGGMQLGRAAGDFASDVAEYLQELGTDNQRVAVEYVNPSITLALAKRGLDVVDGVNITEQARVIKSDDEITCMRWAIAVAEHGIAKMKEVMRPGVSELQLWGLLNYTNLANNGDWHDGRMLASGPRTNPWIQEASPRKVEAGDLVGFDTDMVGPFGYFADISRTFFCAGKGTTHPSTRQKQLYQLAVKEVEYNLSLVRPGLSFQAFQQQAYLQETEFHQNAYPCIAHAVGMCDEFPRIDPIFRGPNYYDGTLQAGMVLCLESYVGAVGERDGVKLEQQVLITEDGYELLSQYPYEDCLLD